ncbi:hypothetical protein LY78DRAFT_586920, partial [Colletotrichum sublineola]
KTYNTRYSLVVTDPTTNPALTGLSMGERTGSRVFQWVWSYVMVCDSEMVYIGTSKHLQMLLTRLQCSKLFVREASVAVAIDKLLTA